MLSKFLDPKNDVAFKKIFGTQKNQDILIHFLNDVLIFKNKSPIREVSFLKTIQDPETAASKTSIVDILCKDEKGNTYIVEMQVAAEKGFEKRAQYYASKAYISQAKSGSIYQDLKEVIFLAIADYVMFPEKKEYKSDHVILDRKSYEQDLKDFSFTFIELPKFTKTIDELSSLLEKWCYFFKHAEETKESELKKIVGSDSILERAYEELNRFSWNEEELLTYDQMEKYQWAHQASMDKKFEEGESHGLAKGLAKGRSEGRAEAILGTARALLKQGVDPAVIQSATGLSKEEIASLQAFSKRS